MNIFKTKRINILSVVHQLLDELNVKVNSSTILKSMESHPDYPSLLSICDFLTMLNIDNQVYRIENKDFDVLNLQFPFITHLSKDGGNFLLVHEIKHGHFRVSDENNKNRMIAEREFLSSWEGIVLYAEANQESGEPDFYQNYIESFLRKITFPAFILTLLSIIMLISLSYPLNWILFGLIIIKLTGIGVSILLLGHSINSGNSFIRNVCGSGEKNNCNAILQSEDANITSWLSWAEVGFFYFSGSFLVVLIFPVLVPVLLWINIIALPFTIYSVVYQYSLKKWCTLCCIVQGLLILECIFFNFTPGLFSTDLIPSLLFPFLLCFILPIVSWGLIKPILLAASTVKPLQQQLNKFKYNSELFMLALTNQNHYETAELDAVILGDSQSQTIITIVSNPFCSPCGKAHIFLEEWLRQRADLQVRVILLVDTESSQVRMAQHLTALGLLKDKSIVRRALKDWYVQDDKVYELWAEKYPVTITEAVKVAFLKQKKWIGIAEIIFTPTIFVNGYKMPESYQLEDLKYLMN